MKKILAILSCIIVSGTLVACDSSLDSLLDFDLDFDFGGKEKQETNKDHKDKNDKTEDKKSDENTVTTENEGTYTLVKDKKGINITQAQGPIKITIDNLRISKFKPNQNYKKMFSGKDDLVCVEMDTTIENTSDQTINFLPTSSRLVLEDKTQVKIDFLKSNASTSSLNAKAKSPNKLAYFIPKKEIPKSFLLYINGPMNLNKDSFAKYNDFSIDIKVD